MPSAGLSPRRAVQLTALLALLVLYTAQLAGALWPNLPVFVTASAVGILLDLYLQHRQPGLVALLGKVRFDVVTRQLLRDMIIVVGLVRLPNVHPIEERQLVPLLLGCYLAHFVCQGVGVLVRRNRTLPIVTRNVDTSGLKLTQAPPRLLARRSSQRLLRFLLPATAGLLTTAVTSSLSWALTGLSVSLLLFAGGAGYQLTWLLPKYRTVGEQQALKWLDEWLAEYKPTVGMYFSGGASSAYQANMWLSTLAALDGHPIIVLRERFMVQKIDATDVPDHLHPEGRAPDAPGALDGEGTAPSRELRQDLAGAAHPHRQARLHQPRGERQALLLQPVRQGLRRGLGRRTRGPRAVPARRHRRRRPRRGGGRPPAARPDRALRRAPGPRAKTTVLYAPTWEGWTEDPGNTSVILAGENIVRELLADDGVRLLYKPHPMTGSVDPRAGAADQRIRAMIAEANAQGSGDRPGPEAATELARRTAELDRLTTTAFRMSADEVERMLLQSRPDPGRAESVATALEAWEAAYWAAFPEWEHQIIVDARPGIYACFNQADLLISDVSSVVSDYLSSEKPYAVANTSGLSEDEFVAGFPTVRAATILTPSAKEIPTLLAAVRDPSGDALADKRADLKVHLLGPADPPSLARFNEAALALCDAADERNTRAATRSGTDPEALPGQRETRNAAEEIEQDPAADTETPAPAAEEDPVTTA